MAAAWVNVSTCRRSVAGAGVCQASLELMKFALVTSSTACGGHGDFERGSGIVQRQERLAQLPERKARWLEVGAQFVQTFAVRQRRRVIGAEERGISVGIEILRRGAEILGRLAVRRL